MAHKVLCGAGALSLLLAGCGSATIGGAKGFSTANDELRTKVAALEAENAQLKAIRTELEGRLAQEQRVREGLVSQDVLAAMPACSGIAIDSLSGLFPASNDVAPTTCNIYIKPFDGRQRFVQIVGTVRAEVHALDPAAAAQDAGKSPVTIGTLTLTPAQLREAYRSGLTGTHYTLEVPITSPDASLHKADLVIRVQFEDALTGKVHEATQNVNGR